MSLSTVLAEIQPGNGFREDHVGVSTVAPPCKKSARIPPAGDGIGGHDRVSLGRAIGSPKSVCAEIPSSKHPRYCPPCGPEHRQGFPTPRPREEKVRRPRDQIEQKCSSYNVMVYPCPPPSVNHLRGFFWCGKRRARKRAGSVSDGGWSVAYASGSSRSLTRSSYRPEAFSRRAARRRGRQRRSPRILSWPRCRATRTGCRA